MEVNFSAEGAAPRLPYRRLELCGIALDLFAGAQYTFYVVSYI